MNYNRIKRLDGNGMKSIENINIWNDVTENTKEILITNEDPESQKIKFFKAIRNKWPRKIIGNKRPPECVIINFFGHPELEIENLEGMPQNLPNLEIFEIWNLKLKSLKGMPQNLTHLKDLQITNINLKNLSGIPKNLPNLEALSIGRLKLKDLSEIPRNLLKLEKLSIGATISNNLTGMPQNLPTLKELSTGGESLESLKGIPNSFPKLEKLKIFKSSIQNLEYFPTNTPNLKEISLNHNKLISLKGLPSHIPVLKRLDISNNQLTSLEDLPYQFDDIQRQFGTKKRTPLIDYHNNPIRTFAGIKYHKIPENMYQFNFSSNFQLCPSFLNLIKKYLEITAEYSIRESKYLEQDEFDSGLITALSHDYDDVEMPTAEDFKRYRREIPALKATIIEYYRKTPMELAQQYVETPEALTKNELERLGWEGGYKERQLLESNFSPDNPILKEISNRITHQLSSGFSILK